MVSNWQTVWEWLAHTEVWWCVGFAALGIGSGLINTRDHRGGQKDRHSHYWGYCLFALTLAALAAMSSGLILSEVASLKGVKHVTGVFYAVSALVGLSVGFLEDRLHGLLAARVGGSKENPQTSTSKSPSSVPADNSVRKRESFRPEWVGATATIVIAVCAVVGLVKVEDILNAQRVKAIENHTTWVEVRPIAFGSKGERDPADLTSTLWYLVIEAQNLGRETAVATISNWDFQSALRGSVDFKIQDRTLSLLP